MGVVYRATHLRLQRADALKVIAPELADEAAFRSRFERESLLAAQIDHPNVIPIYAAGEEEGLLYIAMRCVEGTDLRAMLHRAGRIEPRRAAEIVMAVASALDAAHERGLVHRDVKPANVLITPRNDREHVYLSDFGLAKMIASGGGETRTGMFVGTTDYISPEQVLGERLDARTDVYSLGCTLFHMLTGQVPYPGESDPAKLVAHTRDPVPSVLAIAPDLPSEFEAVIARAMAKPPDERYPSAGDLGRAALAAAEGRTLVSEQQSVAKGDAAPAMSTIASPISPSQERDATILAGRGHASTEPATVAATEVRKPAPRRPVPGAPPPHDRRRRFALAGGVAAAVVAAIAIALIASGGGGAQRGVAAIANHKSLGAITVGNAPDGITVGLGSVWVANAGSGTVTRIDETSARVLATLTYARHSEPAVAVSIFGNVVWVVDDNGGTVERLDVSNGKPSGSPISVGGHPDGMALTGRDIWVASYDDGTVTRIDGGNETPVGTIKVGRGPRRMASGHGVWVPNSGDGTVTRIDPTTGKVTAKIKVGGHPVAIAVTRNDLWVLDAASDTVTRFDVGTEAPVGSPIHVGPGARRLAASQDTVWVANSGDGTVERIDAHGNVLATIKVGGYPDAIGVVGGIVWVAIWSRPTIRYHGPPGTVVRIDEQTEKVLPS
jgi:serine/threonine-protein kinase